MWLCEEASCVYLHIPLEKQVEFLFKQIELKETSLVKTHKKDISHILKKESNAVYLEVIIGGKTEPGETNLEKVT